jgi:hypothetical protein
VKNQNVNITHLRENACKDTNCPDCVYNNLKQSVKSLFPNKA